MSELNVNRDRRELLTALANGRVYRSLGGCDLWAVRAGQNKRVERRLRELRSAGWVADELRDSRYYQLTEAGSRALDGAV